MRCTPQGEDFSPSRGTRTERNRCKESPITKEQDWFIVHFVEENVEAALRDVTVLLWRSGEHTDEMLGRVSIAKNEVRPKLVGFGDEVTLGFSEVVCWLLAWVGQHGCNDLHADF